MIDIHSHVLPEVDDGSDDVETSVLMLEEAARQGVTDIILTPHYRVNCLTDKADLEQKFLAFKEVVKDKGINVALYLGQEIYAFNDIVSALKNGKLCTLNGTEYVLVEFSFKQETDIPEIVYMLKASGYIPIVAHIERYPYADIELAREIKELGGLIQVNANTVCVGRFHRRRIFAMIKEGLIDFISSDVHSKRPSEMDRAYEVIKKKFGEETANKLFNENAKAIIGK